MTSRPIRKILIANRGEIACRIMRTAAARGIATVAVFSDADRSAPHVKQADEAVWIGPSPAADSYLRADVILDAARKTGADALHPGYGFLSENAAFAKACLDAGLIFIGPPADAISAMGDKAQAKALMQKAGVPTVPGYQGNQDDEALAIEAKNIGAPLLIKAVAGGGGRGMRRVDDLAQFADALTSARREAENAFGNGDVMLEKLITNGRHIEIQIFADVHGNVVHLGERDCSAQRRHQKVIEEAPSPFVTKEMRTQMGADAIATAKAVNYRNAGTVEFIVDSAGQHYFLEMNTRLQVEHPVSEMVTGLDLVDWQLRVASGQPLPLTQDEITLTGHAIEARLYAEDPYAGFAPQTGQILVWNAGQAQARVDSGIAEGGEISPFYDPMVAKIIAHGHDREAAIQSLQTALEKTPLLGVKTNRKFLRDLLASDAFTNSAMTTSTLDRWITNDAPILQEPRPAPDDIALAGLVLALESGGSWWRSSSQADCPLTLHCGETAHTVRIAFERGAVSSITVDGAEIALKAPAICGSTITFTREGVSQQARFARTGTEVWLDRNGVSHNFSETDLIAPKEAANDPTLITAPVSGMVRAVLAKVADTVEAGQTVAIIEAMKMETSLTAARAGTISALHATEGAQAKAGDVLVELELSDDG